MVYKMGTSKYVFKIVHESCLAGYFPQKENKSMKEHSTSQLFFFDRRMRPKRTFFADCKQVKGDYRNYLFLIDKTIFKMLNGRCNKAFRNDKSTINTNNSEGIVNVYASVPAPDWFAPIARFQHVTSFSSSVPYYFSCFTINRSIGSTIQ